ncbi:MAG: glycerol-3-phosphate 1-O-acyltransferase PlsY [Nitrospirae bacterium]|nr:glycerol-3-phosphate 1-O-acyltransferase PlsY [Nitrospirota bacterium]
MTVIKMLMVFISYFAGSIPFGMIISTIMGAGDIRKQGSGNIGATNVLRTTGKFGGALTLLLDALKGAVPVLIAKSLWGLDNWTLAIALAAILGHNYTIFLKFRGGKGVATSLGVLFALWPYIGVITMSIWIAGMFIWKYSSLAALISFGILPVVTSIGERSISFSIFSIIISALLYFRHIENIRRLLAGQEGKIGAGRSKPMILLLIILVSSNAAFAETAVAYDRLMPVELERLWNERQSAVASGDLKAADNIINEIVKTKYKLGINRIDVISALLVREGYLALEDGMPEKADRLSKIAMEISPDYAPSHYLAAKSLRSMSGAGKGEIVNEYLAGVRSSISDFWTLFNYVGRLYTVILLALSISIMVFTVSLCCRFIPLFLHTFKEITSGFLNSPFNVIFFIIIAFVSLLFGIAWFVLMWIVISWIYMSRNDKIFATCCIILLLLLPGVLQYSTLYLTAHNNVTLQGLIAAERGYGEPGLIEILKDQERKEPDNNYITFSIAYLSNKDDRTEDSLTYFEKLTGSSLRNIRINALNSIGNINFYRGNFDKAIAYYMDTIKISPESALPFYNLSQAYREKLLFSEAGKSYETAKKISIHDVERFTSLSAKGDGYRVIEYPISMRDLWHVALTTSDETAILVNDILQALIRIPAERFPFLGISLGIILSVLSYIKPKTPMAYYCPDCNRSVCGRCTGSRIFGGICKTCKRGEQQSGTPALRRMQIYFLIPGLWHMLSGHIIKGIFLSMIFGAGISGLIVWRAYNTWETAYYQPVRSFILWISLITLSYLLLYFSGIRPFRSSLRQ